MTQTELPGTPANEGAGSLKPVIDAIPAEAFENPTWRGLSYFFRDLAIYAAVITGLVFVRSWWLSVPLELLAILAVTGLFIVGHDSAHGALFKSKRMNSAIGHLSMLPSWHVYEAWVLGHNRIHHAFTVRQGYDFVWHPVTPQEYAAFGRWRRLLHRVEWSWPGAGLYYLKEVWWSKMIVFRAPARWVRAIRRDRMMTYGFAATMALVFGWLGYVRGHSIASAFILVARVELIPFLGFSVMIGSVVHVHHVQKDIQWWKRNEWTKFKGQMEGTTILRVPKGFDFFFHWIMVHTPHHVDQRVPMYNLKKAAAAIEKAFPSVVHDEPWRLRDFRRTTKACKLYDFDLGRWLTYAEGRALLQTA